MMKILSPNKWRPTNGIQLEDAACDAVRSVQIS